MKVTVKYKDESGVQVSLTLGDITQIVQEDGKIVAMAESGAKLVAGGTTLYVESEEGKLDV